MLSLGKVGIADRGAYSPDVTYMAGDFVQHEGSTWLATADNLIGVTPAEGTAWKYLARGFAAEMLSVITAVDTYGVVGDPGSETNSQTLIDKLADAVANKLVTKNMMSSVNADNADMIPTLALTNSMAQDITALNSALYNQTSGLAYGGNSSNKWVALQSFINGVSQYRLQLDSLGNLIKFKYNADTDTWIIEDEVALSSDGIYQTENPSNWNSLPIYPVVVARISVSGGLTAPGSPKSVYGFGLLLQFKYTSISADYTTVQIYIPHNNESHPNSGIYVRTVADTEYKWRYLSGAIIESNT